MKISLCIPTMNRWDFLKINIPKYLENPYIDEIIISDENGDDVKHIRETFINPKIKTYTNERVLGVFLNKERVVSYATNEWVCLMDSDNFAPVSYFEAFFTYLNGTNPDNRTIYMPAFTIPQTNHGGFNFRQFIGININIDNYKDMYKVYETLFNVGNYIFNKNTYMNASLNKDEEHLIYKCMACDVLFKNYLLLTRSNCTLVTVPNMSYDHIVHSGSLYINTVAMTDTEYFYKLFK